MAHIGNSCVKIGSPDWDIGDPLTYVPSIGEVFPGSAHVALNTIARIDAGSAISTDPRGETLTFEWKVIKAPPKSTKTFETEGSSLFLTIDEIGAYGVQVTAITPNGGCSAVGYSILIGQPFSYASEPLQVYDVSWLWQILPDFWGQLPQRDLSKFETLWRGLQQLLSSEVNDILNIKDSYSIATVQDRVFRRWRRIDFSMPLTSYRVKLSDNSYTVSTVETRHINTSSTISSFTDTQLSGRLVKSNVLLIDNYNVRSSVDSGKTVKLVINQEIFVTKIVGEVSVGKRLGALLAKHIKQIVEGPILCSVSLRNPVANELGAIRLGNDLFSATLQTSTRIHVDDLIEQSDTSSVEIKNQLYVEDAFRLGVRAGDKVKGYIRDDQNRRFPISLTVNDCVGDFIVLEDMDWKQLVRDSVQFFYPEDLSERDELIINEIESSLWRSRYLDLWQNNSSLLEFGVGSALEMVFIVELDTIHRRTTTVIENDITSLVRLTERTERVITSSEGVVQTEGGDLLNLGREPLSLLENLDFYIKKETDTVRGIRRIANNVIEADQYDFSFCGVVKGQTFLLKHPFVSGSYTVRGVSGRQLTISPEISTDFVNATLEFTVSPGDEQTTLILDTQLPDDLDYLWAEVSIETNYETLEYTFGNLVGLSYEPWHIRGLPNTYKDALLGILFARVMQPSIDIIQTAVSILAGVPFTPTTSRIHKIQDAYLLDAFGQPSKGRITLEEIDAEGNRTERFSSFLFSANRQDRDSSYTGLAFNDETGNRYTEGDIVEQMRTLALGVKIYDLYTGADTYELDPVKDRHRFIVRIDTDSAQIYTGETLEFIYDFIVELKPVYTSFILALQKFVSDDVIIEEDIFWKMNTRLYDNPYHHRGPANVLDDVYPDRPERDLPILMPLTTWFPSDGVLSFSNNVYTLQSATGGFVDPSTQIPIYIDQPWIRAGDYIIMRESGCILIITSVVSDTEVTASSFLIRKDEREVSGYTEQNLRFYVARPRLDTILDTTLSLTPNIDFSFSLLGDMANDIGMGDLITLPTGPILRVVNKYTDTLGTTFYETYPPRPRFTSGANQVRVFREQISDRVLFNGNVSVVQTGSEVAFVQLGTSALGLGIEPGNEISIGSITCIVTASMSSGLVGLSTPLPSADFPSGSYQALITKFNTNEGEDDLDEHERATLSAVHIYLRSKKTFDVSNGIIKDTQGILKPGDLLYNVEDPYTSDYGEGEGASRVVAPVSGTSNLYYTTYSSSYNTDSEFVIIKQAPLRYTYLLGSNSLPQYIWGQEQWRLRYV